MKDKIQPKVVKERAGILRKLGDELGRKFREQFVGETCEVLIEDFESISGRCERYFMVQVQDDAGCLMLDARNRRCGFGSPVQSQSSSTRGRPCGSILKVKITAVDSDGATGEVNVKH